MSRLKIFVSNGCLCVSQDGQDSQARSYGGAIKTKFYPSKINEEGTVQGILININDDVYDVNLAIDGINVSGSVNYNYSDAFYDLTNLLKTFTYTNPVY